MIIPRTAIAPSTRLPIWTHQRREMLIFLERIFVWHACTQALGRHILTQCSFAAFGSIALTQQNGCKGALRVIDSEQFPFRISKDPAPTPLPTVGILFIFTAFLFPFVAVVVCFSFFFFSFCCSCFVCFCLSSSISATHFFCFFLCIALFDSWRFGPFSLWRTLPLQ